MLKDNWFNKVFEPETKVDVKYILSYNCRFLS